MKTKDFIAERLFTKPSCTKWCSSVMQMIDGDFYSYGVHYPLLFTVNGRLFINTRGYSNSTSKHIGWAWSACNYQATAVKLDGSDISVKNIIKSLKLERDQLEKDIIKGRNGSAIQNWRLEEVERVNKILISL